MSQFDAINVKSSLDPPPPPLSGLSLLARSRRRPTMLRLTNPPSKEQNAASAVMAQCMVASLNHSLSLKRANTWRLSQPARTFIAINVPHASAFSLDGCTESYEWGRVCVSRPRDGNPVLIVSFYAGSIAEHLHPMSPGPCLEAIGLNYRVRRGGMTERCAAMLSLASRVSERYEVDDVNG
jgi:hypothetical protein